MTFNMHQRTEIHFLSTSSELGLPLPTLINDVHENESIGDGQETRVIYVTSQATEEWKRSRRGQNTKNQ